MEAVVVDTSHRSQRQPITPNSAERNLCIAIKNNEGLERVRSLVEEEGADISCLCDKYWTPLTLAAGLGRLDVVFYLLHCIKQVSFSVVNYNNRHDFLNKFGLHTKLYKFISAKA